MQKKPLDELMDAIIEDMGIYILAQEDGRVLLGIGHEKFYGDEGSAEVDFGVDEVAELLREGFVIRGNIDKGWLSHKEDGMRLSEKALQSYLSATILNDSTPRLASLCSDLMLQGKWDTAIREAMLLIETRLREMSGANSWGAKLVDDALGQKGALAHKFGSEGERQGFRDLFAGAMAVIRNDYAHNFKAPSKREADTAILLADMLLKKLDALQ